MKEAILKALEARYEAKIAEADATMKIYLEKSVGIGEHPQHLIEMDKFVSELNAADEKLTTLKKYFNNKQI